MPRPGWWVGCGVDRVLVDTAHLLVGCTPTAAAPRRHNPALTLTLTLTLTPRRPRPSLWPRPWVTVSEAGPSVLRPHGGPAWCGARPAWE